MHQRKTRKTPTPTTPGALKAVRAIETAVSAELEKLSKKYGADTFRLAAQRHFKHQAELTQRQRKIEELQAELRDLSK